MPLCAHLLQGNPLLTWTGLCWYPGLRYIMSSKRQQICCYFLDLNLGQPTYSIRDHYDMRCNYNKYNGDYYPSIYIPTITSKNGNATIIGFMVFYYISIISIVSKYICLSLFVGTGHQILSKLLPLVLLSHRTVVPNTEKNEFM